MNQYKEVKLHYSVAVRHDSTLEWLIPFAQLVAFLAAHIDFIPCIHERAPRSRPC